MSELVVVVVSVGVLVLGLPFAALGGYMWMEQTERIDSYETTEATVVSSTVGVSPGGDDTTYYPDVTYEYTVGGQTYESTNVLPGAGRTSRSGDWARTVVEDHPEGETVTVHYDPADPSNAFLVPRRQTLWLVVAGFGGVLVLGGFAGGTAGLVGAVRS